jgi:hypothetical protein
MISIMFARACKGIVRNECVKVEVATVRRWRRKEEEM